MRTNKQIEDQFLKLHPCLPIETRIAIIGAGPSGLSAAYALAKLGYLNVTIFEKYHAVAGMCESVDIEGEDLIEPDFFSILLGFSFVQLVTWRCTVLQVESMIWEAKLLLRTVPLQYLTWQKN